MKKFITRAYGATRLVLKTNAPTLMVGGGVLAMTAGTVLACRQTLQVESVLEKHTHALDKVDQGLRLELEGYQADHARNDRIKVYTRASVDLTRLYAVPGVVFISGAGLVFGGHRILVKRNATLALAFTSLSKSFEAYRNRVRMEFGNEVDAGLASGHVMRQVTNEQGEREFVPEKDLVNPEVDPYNRIFGETYSTQWENDLGVNKMFVHNAQRMANILLNTRGHLYLSEVYEQLGFPESDISRVTGWKVTRLPDGSRDIPFVDFGLDRPHPMDEACKIDNAIYLDFNCQGLIIGGRVQKALEKA